MDYYGEQKIGNERSNSSSSSRKGKKSGNSSKPKQPQRGLGVAQLEKIRLQSQLGCSYLPSPHSSFYPNHSQDYMRMQEPYSSPPTSTSTYNFRDHQSIMMGIGELERGNIRFDDSQPDIMASWIPGNDMLEHQQIAQPSMARHFMNLQVEDAKKDRRKRRNDARGGSSSQNSETSDSQELDLELKLSL